MTGSGGLGVWGSVAAGLSVAVKINNVAKPEGENSNPVFQNISKHLDILEMQM